MLSFHVKFTTFTATFYYTLRNLLTISIITIILGSANNVANAEYFSSIDSLQKLSDVEMGLIEAVREYLELQQLEFQLHSRFIENIKLQHSKAMEDAEDYLGNPINAFTLIKRMVTDWNNLNEFIKQSQAQSAFSEMLTQFNQEQKIPDDVELRGAVKGLLRLQKVYNLNASDLANGQINEVYTGTELTWNECFEIATSLFDQKEFKISLSWFEIVLDKLIEMDSTEKDPTLHRFKIETLEYLALIHYELGNSEEAIEYIDEILILEPNHHTKDLRIYIEHSPPKQPLIGNNSDDFDYDNSKNYTRLCQGIQFQEKRLRNLKCLIKTRNNPQFILAPLKIEQLSRDPEITVYHGLLTNVQIDQIVDEAENKMDRSRVGTKDTGIISNVRVSQQAWLAYESPAMKSIYNLVGDITGLDLSNAETMQVANYGIGGQYDPHHDFFGADYLDERFPGDRIATNVLYLSDVEQGGFTVFPHINVFARPVKGSMVSWYNLHKSVDGDFRTLHAGCPVITGSKRIGNVWIHSGSQEFRRPCGLKRDAHKSEAYYTR